MVVMNVKSEVSTPESPVSVASTAAVVAAVVPVVVLAVVLVVAVSVAVSDALSDALSDKLSAVSPIVCVAVQAISWLLSMV